MDKQRLSRLFEHFGSQYCKGSSRLYEYLSARIAQDESLLALAAEAAPSQPVPNMLFGAVQYLLLSGKEHELRLYYDSLVDRAIFNEAAFDCFKHFCLLYSEEFISLLRTRRVQTNELRRCSYLYPSFCHIYSMTNKPLALIEIGTSAGLLLLWDRYRYSYGDESTYGNAGPALTIASELRGANRPDLLSESPPVAERIGIDLHINDLTNPDQYMWLKALIWPEHRERRLMLEQAVRYVKDQPLHLIEGNGLKLLTDIVAEIPKDRALCVYHTHVANQFAASEKQELLDLIRRIGEQRDVFHLYNNMGDEMLHLDSYIAGKERQSVLAEMDGHGRWFTWLHQ